MRKCLLLCLVLFSKISFAAPGDTTWVQAHHLVQHPNYGNYDTLVYFPKLGNPTFQRIIMEWTVGKYICPGTPQYCSDWDYDINYYAMKPAGDTIELARLITPYGNSPRMPNNWTQRYYFDVSEAYKLLADSAIMRAWYKGYSGGFTTSVRFAFIEGTPSREVIDFKRLWSGGMAYGGSTSIDSIVQSHTLTPPSNTQSAALKFTITGHGADDNYCSEFCSKWYEVKLNGNMISHKDIWRDDCGNNQLYPQNGTWIYNRANWCPGDKVLPFIHVLDGVNGANTYNIDVDFQPYVKQGTGTPSYSLEGVVYHYGAFYKQLDLTIDDVIVPTDYEGHFRENPSCASPKITVKNLGADTVHEVKIMYSFPDIGTQYQHTATINLASMQSMDILLPATDDLKKHTGNNNIFQARLVGVNGGIDEEPSNDGITSYFTAPVIWDPKLKFEFRSNNTLDNRWKLYDEVGNVVAQRTPTATGTWYYDTLSLAKGCYKLVIEDDGCDGLRWWANSAQGIGNMRVEPMNSNTPLPMKGYTFGNSYEGDFGCHFAYQFVVDSVLSVKELNKNKNIPLQIRPNPTSDKVTIQLNEQNLGGRLELRDMSGKLIHQEVVTNVQHILSVEQLPAGLYLIHYTNHNYSSIEKLEVRR